MAKPYDHQALLLKAKLFLNRAMEDEDVRAFDERALWASLALELLAKAALARVSPLLIAEPTEEGLNLLIASGLVEGETRFTSVRAKTLYSRCSKAFKPFDDAEASKITSTRNDYLHGSAAGFTGIPEHAWWPRFWNLAVILINTLEVEVSDVVGYGRAQAVKAHLERNKKNVEHRTEMLIERARQRRKQYESGTLPAKVAAAWSPGDVLPAGLRYSELVTCPACEGRGHIEGEEAMDVDVQYEQLGDDDFRMSVYVTASAEYFSCSECGLVPDNYQLIEQAGLDTQFDTEGGSDDLPDYEGDYGND